MSRYSPPEYAHLVWIVGSSTDWSSTDEIRRDLFDTSSSARDFTGNEELQQLISSGRLYVVGALFDGAVQGAVRVGKRPRDYSGLLPGAHVCALRLRVPDTGLIDITQAAAASAATYYLCLGWLPDREDPCEA